MDFLRQHVLAGSVLAGDEHRGVRGRNLVQGFPDGGHGLGGAPEHEIPGRAGNDVRLRHARPRSGIAAHRFPGLVPGGGEDLDELVVLPGFHQEVEGAALHAFHRQGDVGIGRKEDDFHVRRQFFDLPRPVKPLVAGIDAGVEIHVQQHHVRPELLQGGDQRRRRRKGLHLGKMHRQKDFQRPADAQVVIDDQYFSDFGSHCHKLCRDKDTTNSRNGNVRRGSRSSAAASPYRPTGPRRHCRNDTRRQA